MYFTHNSLVPSLYNIHKIEESTNFQSERGIVYSNNIIWRQEKMDIRIKIWIFCLDLASVDGYTSKQTK